jgi:predicted PurR-regulated permease PerM
VLINTAAFGLSVYFIHAVADFIIPILLTGVILLTASPLLEQLLSKRVPQRFACFSLYWHHPYQWFWR